MVRAIAAVVGLLAVSSATAPRPLVGIVWHDRLPDRLVHVDPGSLQPLPGRAISLANAWTWSFSPDHLRLAVAESRRGNSGCGRASLRLVDPRALRTISVTPLGSGELSAMLWTESRLLTLHERCDTPAQFVVRDGESARALNARSIDGSIIRSVATDEALVLLVAPRQRVGAARVVVLQGSGAVRSITLGEVPAGEEWSPRDVKRSLRPALAVGGRRAFVIPAGGPVAEIDLDSLTVSYHPLQRRSFAARAKASEGWTRQALFVNGVLAVSGRDDEALELTGALHVRERPAGLELIDTRTWSVRRADAAATWVTHGEGLLFATRYTWDSTLQKVTGMGIVAYDLAGRKRFQLFAGTVAGVAAVHRGRLYVRRDESSRLAVVRLPEGRILGTRASPLPHVLLGRSSTYWRNGI